MSAQQFNSEDDINNYYRSQINETNQKISYEKQRREYAKSLPDRDGYGNKNIEKTEILLEVAVTIAVLEDKLRFLEEERSNKLSIFRQQQQKAAEEQARRIQEQKEKQRQQQVDKQHLMEKQKKQTEQFEKQRIEEQKKHEENERKKELYRKLEAEREEKIRQEKERRYNEGYARSIASSARGFEKNMQELSKMDRNSAQIKNNHQADGLPRKSGYVPASTSSSITITRPKDGILPKGKQTTMKPVKDSSSEDELERLRKLSKEGQILTDMLISH
jgi:hypothetical protein